MAEFDYQQDMQIDPDALDVEWLRQAELARKYAKHVARLKRDAMTAEERVKVVKAELTQECTMDPMGCTGKEKPTAPDVDAYIRTHKRHKEAKEDWIEATYRANYAELAQKEISWTRKAALENLVTLHGQQYFAGPCVPRNLRKEFDERNAANDTANAAVGEAMIRRRQ